jgi:hypothetical protein
MRGYEGTTYLQGLGEVQGIRAINLKVGDHRIYNQGHETEILDIKSTKSGKTLYVTTRWYDKFGEKINGKWVGKYETYLEKIRVDTIIAVKELN